VGAVLSSGSGRLLNYARKRTSAVDRYDSRRSNSSATVCMCVSSSASSSRVPGASRAADLRAPLLALDDDATFELRALLDRAGASMATA
jgi:hypothetical protein